MTKLTSTCTGKPGVLALGSTGSSCRFGRGQSRHVQAAAVAGGAQVVATFNVKDFPLASVEPHDIGVVHPDAFLL